MSTSETSQQSLLRLSGDLCGALSNDDDEFYDVTIVAGDCRVRAHRSILAARVPVLRPQLLDREIEVAMFRCVTRMQSY